MSLPAPGPAQTLHGGAGTWLQPTYLVDGVASSATQRADDRITYFFEAESNRNYLIVLDQQGLDFIVSIEGPDGERRSFNSPLRRDEPEFVLLEGVAGGEYAITVTSEEHTGVVAGHAIRVSGLAREIDDAVVGAWRLMSQAAERYFRGGQEEWAAARGDYFEAAERWRSLGQTRQQAQALYSVAMIDYWHTKDREKSRALAEEAMRLYTEIDEHGLRAKTAYLQATSLIETPDVEADTESQFAEALLLFEQAAEIQERLGLVYDLAFTTNDIGLLYYLSGDWHAARRYWSEAVTLFRNVDEWSGELFPVGNLAVIDAEEGYLGTAIEALQHVLELMESGRNLRHRADTLANLGGLQRMFGNFDEALRRFSEALALGEEIEDVYVVGWALSGIGETYYSMGEVELASQYLEAALPKEREAGDQRGEAAVLRYLGSIEYGRGNYAAALYLHQQALELVTAPPDRILVKLLLAQDLAALGRYEDATQAAEQAFEVASETDSLSLRADALEQLGQVRLAAGESEAAIVKLEEALAIYESLGLHSEQARALNGLALASMALGELERAVEYGEDSLSHIESIRGSLADPRLRAFYLGARRDYYDLQIHLLLQLHHRSAFSENEYAAFALAVSERARARMLVDLLREAAVEVRASDPELGRRREGLLAALAELRRQRDQALLQVAPHGSGYALADIVGGLAAIEHELNLLETDVRTRDPKWGDLNAPKPLAASELQQALDADSALVEYALGVGQSYVWVVTRQSIEVVTLADRKTIEDAAIRVYEGLRAHAHRRTTTLAEDLSRLADLVLTPVAPLISTKRLLIAADGALQYVPFGVLPVQSPEGPDAPLLATREVVGLPSLSALINLRAGEPRVTSRGVAIFADPVFASTDPRFAFPNAGNVTPFEGDNSLSRSALRSGGSLARLTVSAHEAEVIARLTPEGERFVAVGFEASRETVLNMELGDYRILHFATHARIDSRYPDLSALALSQFDASGASKDGFLGLPDIYGLALNADLVVLSACETALGREIRGEGLLGFTQGFLYAGARSLVVSLWPVEDRATAELMARFYDHMLNGGLRPAEALRRAQLSIAAERRWSDPYFWGAFTVLGEWQ